MIIEKRGGRLIIRIVLYSSQYGFSIVLNGSDPALSPQPHRKFGRCWTLYPPEWIRKHGIYYIKVQIKAAIKIYLHQNKQFLDLSGRMGYKVYVGDKHQSQINYRDMVMLEKPDKGDGKFICKSIDYDKCMYGAVTDRMVNETGCVAPWVKNRTYEICDERNSINTSFWIAYNRITNQEKDCPSPCNFLLINVGDKNYAFVNKSSYGYFYYYFAPRVTISTEHYLYSGLSVFAEIGGYVGLLLGVSFLHSAELIGNVLQKRIDKYKEMSK